MSNKYISDTYKRKKAILKEEYYKKKELGICVYVNCKNKTLNGVYCEKHRKMNSERSRSMSDKSRKKLYSYMKTYLPELQRKKKKWLIEKLGGKCNICGYNKNFAALELHHINGKDKEEKLLSRSLIYLEQIIGKLQLLCANCHREKHHPTCEL